MAFASPTYHEAVAIQRAMAVEAKRTDLKTGARVQAANAFIALEYLKRVMKGKPNPKPAAVQPSNGKRALINLKTYIPRKKLIELRGLRQDGPPTQITSSPYYQAQTPAGSTPETPAPQTPVSP